MKLKDLESHLSHVRPFAAPKWHLEQYPTSAHLAARMLYTAESMYSDICDSHVVDLGTGAGMLAIASAMMGAGHVTAVDIDTDALAVCRENLRECECEDLVDLVHADLGGEQIPLRGGAQFDVVVTNPPFGTKNSAGIDVRFLQHAVGLAPVVYSLHKSSTREYLKKRAADWGCDFEVVAEMKFDIPQMYKFHKKKSVDVMVDLIRLERKPPSNSGRR
ncbi:S-adenosyl-L-methionine-dependent methyltransferase [Catenaria anguillulae PL171]|uniref:Methyltransferase-like protein 5 n=1 Tax=Catenaria anguillulae PL171 TaxID=765915 RepID=A0A1Y2HUF2_9FUNG|nr:S-adenosyl-L-methionine-dependent methyltransferase [Catenaria anguillulae PL171]